MGTPVQQLAFYVTSHDGVYVRPHISIVQLSTCNNICHVALKKTTRRRWWVIRVLSWTRAYRSLFAVYLRTEDHRSL
jgi:hypothetical protein